MVKSRRLKKANEDDQLPDQVDLLELEDLGSFALLLLLVEVAQLLG